MPRTNNARIPNGEWERHKSKIQKLYLEEKRSLMGKNGVIELMKQEGLSASKPQFESQFLRWGFKKKLSRETWHIIGHKISSQDRAGLLSHVYAYGIRLSDEKVKKEAARYKTCNENEECDATKDLPLGIEVRSEQEEGEETVFGPEVIAASLKEPSSIMPSKGTHSLGGSSSVASSLICFQPTTSSALYNGLSVSKWEPPTVDIAPRFAFNLDDWLWMPSRPPNPSSQFLAEADFVLAGSSRSEQVFTECMLSHGNSIPVNTMSLFGNLNWRFFRDFRDVFATMPSIAASSLGQAKHLLPSTANQELQKASADLVIVKQILFLLMNNFAGSDYAVFDTIFEQVKMFSLSQLEDILNALPRPYAASLRQSLLTIAIKSNVPDLVNALLNRSLDANRVTCRFGGDSYTPLGLACSFRRLDIVNVLLSQGIDPNGTMIDDSGKCLVSELIGRDNYKIGKDANAKKDMCDILQCLLNAGSRVGCFVLSRGEFWRYEELVDVYIRCSQFPVTCHLYHDLHNISDYVMQLADHGRATAAVKAMLQGHGSLRSNLGVGFERDRQEFIELAAYAGNDDLVDYFLELGCALDINCMCAAVRGNNQTLVSKCIQAGVNITDSAYESGIEHDLYVGRLSPGADPCLLQGVAFSQYTPTPLAEAIRWGHTAMTRKLLDSGALKTPCDVRLLETALGAGAESGDEEMISLLLPMVKSFSTNMFTRQFGNPIAMATLGGHENIVELLMAAGIEPDWDCIASAILLRNDRLVGLFLDAAASVTSNVGLVYLATQWEDLSVLKKAYQCRSRDKRVRSILKVHANTGIWTMSGFFLASLRSHKKRESPNHPATS